MKDGANRRRRARLACMLAVSYRGAREVAARWRPASVLDVTEAGCRLGIADELAAGAPLLLRFDSPLRDGALSASFEAPAVVQWCRASGPSRRQVGVTFDAPPAGLSEILAALGAP